MNSGKVFFLTLIFCVSFFMGMMRADRVMQKEGDARLAMYVQETVTVIGTIVEDPDERQTNTRIIIHAHVLVTESSYQEIDAKILVSIDPFHVFRYGDTVRVVGKLRVPENFETDTGRIFDYVSYLGKDDIYFQISFAEIERLATGGGNILKRSMLDLKNIFVERINQFFPQPEGALLAGVLFGEQAGLGPDLQDKFRKTGIVHIVVLSGFNVTIVAIFIIWLLKSIFPQKIALVFGIVSIVLFALLVGAGATIVRASAMAILAIIARLLGKEHEVIRALFLAAFIMVLQNPRILLFDISFQLSFLATLSLIYISPIIERYFLFVPESFTLRETFVSTFSAQVFVLPLLLYSIGEFSLVSPIVNILVVPWVSITMLFGFISALLGLVSSLLGMVVMVPTYVVLYAQIQIVEFFGALSFASIIVPQFSVWIMGISYAVISGWLIYIKRKNKRE